MADPIGPLLDQDEEEALSPSSSLEVKVPMSPSLSFSSCASDHSPYQTMAFSPFSPASPPPSPPIHSSFLETKAEVDLLPFSLLEANDLLNSHAVAGGGKGKDCSYFYCISSECYTLTDKLNINDVFFSR